MTTRLCWMLEYLVVSVLVFGLTCCCQDLELPGCLCDAGSSIIL